MIHCYAFMFLGFCCMWVTMAWSAVLAQLRQLCTIFMYRWVRDDARGIIWTDTVKYMALILTAIVGVDYTTAMRRDAFTAFARPSRNEAA